MEAIFLLLEDIGIGKGNKAIRKPSKRIMGKGKIIGDIMDPVAPLQDWDALQ